MQAVSTSGALTSRGLSARNVQAYALCEEITGGLIYFMLIFTPWAFGSTQSWSIWVLNGCGYGLGVGLWFKWYIRKIKMYRPTAGKQVRLLGTLTVSILLYCLTSALNARARVDPASGQLEYKNCIEWLPHSFDSASTWQVFAQVVALACFFWALRDWVVHGPAAKTGGARVMSTAVPWRIASVLWVLSISGTLLALEGIVQRLVGSPKLLFLLKPEIHQEAATQFASFAYRANAAQYFNLLWPVTLGFAWMLNREQTSNRSRIVYVLLCCAGVMAACPIISGARGAALVDLSMLLLMLATLLTHSLLEAPTRSRSRKESVRLLLLFCAGTLLLGGGLGGKQLRFRLSHAATDLQERQELCQRARQMAKDYALFGTGPGSFERVFRLYRTSAESYWPAQLHNDWLETKITYGWIGSAFIAAALLVIAWHWITSPLPSRPNLALYLWLGLAGCLIQARWDFPLQVYSIVLLFVCWCSMLLSIGETVTQRPKHAQGISPSTSVL